MAYTQPIKHTKENIMLAIIGIITASLLFGIAIGYVLGQIDNNSSTMKQLLATDKGNNVFFSNKHNRVELKIISKKYEI